MAPDPAAPGGEHAGTDGGGFGGHPALRPGGVLEPVSGTIRQELLARLREGPVGLRELYRELGLREAEVAEHLTHAVRSFDRGGRLGETPAQCLSCGFSFRKRDRVTTPGRCPRCRAERIRPPTFWIEGP